jgi:hypothetical protein
MEGGTGRLQIFIDGPGVSVIFDYLFTELIRIHFYLIGYNFIGLI